MKKLILALCILLSLSVGVIVLVTQDVNAASFEEPVFEEPVFEEPVIADPASVLSSSSDDPSEEADVALAANVPETSETTEPTANHSADPRTAVYDPIYTESQDDFLTAESEQSASAVITNEVLDTVYTTTSVNVRTGPSVDSMRLATLNAGTSVSRTSIDNDGWTEVLFKGQKAYICSDYLSTSLSKNESPKESNETISTFDDDSVSFADTNETVYATTGVNVRSGPGTEYTKLGMCYRGNSVTRIGIGDNGWSKVSYNGSVAYICSDYLSDSKPESVLKEGMYGRLTIPSVGIDVGLYYCTSDNGSRSQSIVNAADSAAYINQLNVSGAIIADHNNQGFEAMKRSKPYETYAYIDFGSYTQTYVCTAIGLGHNYDTDLVDWNGVSLNKDYISGGLAMYTCNENWNNVTISYWQPV